MFQSKNVITFFWQPVFYTGQSNTRNNEIEKLWPNFTTEPTETCVWTGYKTVT
jgi:hypothetical protein